MKVPDGHRAHMGVMATVVVVALLAGVGTGGALALAFVACALAMGGMAWLMMAAMNGREDQRSTSRPQRPVARPTSQVEPPAHPGKSGLEAMS